MALKAARQRREQRADRQARDRPEALGAKPDGDDEARSRLRGGAGTLLRVAALAAAAVTLGAIGAASANLSMEARLPAPMQVTVVLQGTPMLRWDAAPEPTRTPRAAPTKQARKGLAPVRERMARKPLAGLRPAAKVAEGGCPVGSTIELLLPHVNKAGGRTLEATFTGLDTLERELRHRFVSQRPRSLTHRFELRDHHKTYAALAMQSKCYQGKQVAKGCEQTGATCRRWVFMLRDPVERMVSAFYTATGRSVGKVRLPRTPVAGGTGAFGDSHFFCRPGSRAARLMASPESSIEEWAALPLRERNACRAAFNLHVKYLAADERDVGRQLELAKARLRAMTWFGLLDRWAESVQLFSYTLRTDLVHYVPTFNANSYNKTLSENTRRVLRLHNRLDLELFAFARGLFDERVAAMRSDARDAFFKPQAFLCDEHSVCWDKLQPTEAWPMGDAARTPEFASEGERKARVLCAPLKGCTREDLSPEELGDKELRDVERFHGALVAWQRARGGAPVAEAEAGEAEAEEAEAASRGSGPRACLAKLLILGARKGGTTSLYNYVAQHPRFLGIKLGDKAQSGELLLLHKMDARSTQPAQARSAYDAAILAALDQEAALNDGTEQELRRGHKVTGESSVGNGPACQVPRLVKAACGDEMRLVYLVRNPIERLVSQYKMRARLGTLGKDGPATQAAFDALVRSELEAVRAKAPSRQQWWGGARPDDAARAASIPCLFPQDYLNSVWSGMYIVHLARWMQQYDPERLLVIKSETFFRQPANAVRKVLRFIDLDPEEFDVDKAVAREYNAAQPGGEAEHIFVLSPTTRAELAAFFEPYNTALSDHFGIDTSDWL